MDIFTGSYIRDLLIILVKEVIFVEENFAYTQDHALVMFLYDDLNLSQLQETTCEHAF